MAKDIKLLDSTWLEFLVSGHLLLQFFSPKEKEDIILNEFLKERKKLP